jgi:hypothetical protein
MHSMAAATMKENRERRQGSSSHKVEQGEEARSTSAR